MCAYEIELQDLANQQENNLVNSALFGDAYLNSPINRITPTPAPNGTFNPFDYLPLPRSAYFNLPHYSAFYADPQYQFRQFQQFQQRLLAPQCFCPPQHFMPTPGRFQHRPDFPELRRPQWRPQEFRPPEYDSPPSTPARPERDYPPRPLRHQRDRRRNELEPAPAPTDNTPPGNERTPGAQNIRRYPGVIPQNERRALMELALRTAGIEVSEAMINGLNTIIQRESGWNPNIVNNWDSNARKGVPSKGLMQTIGPTFDRYKMPGHDDILNPLHNMLAGIRYATKRYGNLLNVPGLVSMRNGGRYRGY